VINLKLSALAAAGGFTVSLLVGLLSGGGFPLVLIRAFIIGAVFFILAALIWLLINNFIPELLYAETGDSDSGETPGSRIDISVGDGQETALPEMYANSNGDEVGNITDLFASRPVSTGNPGMDQKREDGYTNTSGADFQPEPLRPSAAGLSAGEPLGSEEALPDLDAMAEVFLPAGQEAAGEESEFSPPERKPVGNKPQNLQGDFHPKELAAAIRTAISKE
jgi:hypothetical protein